MRTNPTNDSNRHSAPITSGQVRSRGDLAATLVEPLAAGRRPRVVERALALPPRAGEVVRGRPGPDGEAVREGGTQESVDRGSDNDRIDTGATPGWSTRSWSMGMSVGTRPGAVV